MSKKVIKKPQRNLHACHPIMKKGGVHEKSKGAKRLAAKQETRKKTREWLGRSFNSKASSGFGAYMQTDNYTPMQSVRIRYFIS